MTQSGVRFHEVMQGPLALPETGDTGRVTLRLSADVVIDDLDAFLNDPNHRGQLVGQIDLDGVGRGMPAVGHVELFTAGPEAGGRLMRYQAAFQSGGQRYRMVGTKHVTRADGFNVWGHTTTLFTTVTREQPDGAEATVAAGIIRITLWEGTRLLFSLKATGAPSIGAKVASVMSFAGFFTRQVIAVYLTGPSQRRSA